MRDSRGNLKAILAACIDLNDVNLLGALGRISLAEHTGFHLLGPGWSAQIESAALSDSGTKRWHVTFTADSSKEILHSLSQEHVLSANAQLQVKPWQVIAHFPVAEAFAPLDRAEHLFFELILPSAVALAWLIVWILMERLTSPLEALTLHVRQLKDAEKGPFPLEGIARDEIGVLAEEFNQLVANVREHQKQTEDQLLFLQTLVETIPNPVYYKDTEGKYLGGNRAFEQLLGKSRSEFVGKSAYELAPVQLTWVYQKEDLALLGKKDGAVFETTVLLADGRQHDVIVYKAPFFLHDGGVGGVVGTLLDITERKKMETALAQAKAFSENLLQNSAVPTFVLGPDHHVLFWNRACEKLTGCAAEEVLGTDRHWQAFYPSSTPCLSDYIIDGMVHSPENQYGKISPSPLCPEGFHAEAWNSHLGEKERYLTCDAAPIRDSAGELIAVIETIQDITERKNAEERLRQIADEVSDHTGEEFFQALATYLAKVLKADYVLIGEFDKTILDAVKTVAFVGEDGAGSEVTFFLSESPCETLDPGKARVLASGARAQFPKSHLLEELQVEGYAGMLLTDSAGQTIGMMSVMSRSPITEPDEVESLLKIFSPRAAAELERRQARQSMNHSISLLEATLESTADGILVVDTAYNITSCNKKFMEMWRIPPEVVQDGDARKMREYVHDQVQNPDTVGLQVGYLVHHQVAESYDTITFKDGRVFERHAKPQIINGKIVGYVFCYSDFTERVKAERYIRESEERYRSLFESNHAVMMLVDPHDGAIVDANPAAADYYGWSRQELQRKKISEINTLDSAELQETMFRAWQEEEHHFEFQHRLANGTLRDVEVFTGAISVKGKSLLYTIVHDITERREATDQIRKLSQAIEQSPVTILITDANGIIEYVNPRLTETTGYAAHEVLGTHVQVLGAQEVSPGGYPSLLQDLREGEEWHGEMHSRRKDGELFWESTSISPIRNDQGLVTHFVAVKEDITERKLAEAQKQQTLSLLSATLEATADGILVVDLHRRVVLYNNRFAEMWKIPQELLDGNDDWKVLDYAKNQVKSPAAYQKKIEDLFQVPDAEDSALIHLRDGRIFEGFYRPQRIGAEIVGRVACFRDITDQKRLESQLSQAQKMEAIGNLAGGVAHDFNNLLTVINGYSSQLGRALKDDEKLRQKADLILQAGERASGLTRQLLAFSRRQVLEPKVLNLNELIRNFEKMLSRLIREDIKIVLRLNDDLRSVKADPGQMEQILLNLTVNARDAIDGAGRITISTANAELDQSFVRTHPGAVPGRYVLFSVSDTGSGIDETIQPQIFDPFFTTKEQGRGTGLGLATVYGIVKQSAGYIAVESVPGQGTNFSVYIPLTKEPARPRIVSKGQADAVGQGGLLLVEDQKDVLHLTAQILTDHGFTVFSASTSEEALVQFARQGNGIDLLVTDVVMPGANGIDLATLLRQKKPGLRVLYISGYGDFHGQSGFSKVKGEAFLQKPFTPEGLVQKVQGILA